MVKLPTKLDVLYKIPKKTVLGGKYGTSIALNFATAYAPERNLFQIWRQVEIVIQLIFARSDSILFQDFNIEIKRKINKKLNLI